MSAPLTDEQKAHLREFIERWSLDVIILDVAECVSLLDEIDALKRQVSVMVEQDREVNA